MNRFSVTKRIKSFSYALKGLKYVVSTQHNFWIHILAAILVTAAGFWVNLTKTEWTTVTFCFSAVMAMETINTALELMVDWISPEHQTKAGLIKDVAAAAVLITAIGAAIIGGIIFLPYLL